MPPQTASNFAFGRALRAALLGLGIAFALLLPPLVHFVTGPLSPAIGGYIVGSRERVNPAHGILIGVIMGAAMAIIAGIAVLIGVAVVASTPNLALQFSADKAIAIAALITGYATVTASLGAVMGGQVSRIRSAKAHE